MDLKTATDVGSACVEILGLVGETGLPAYSKEIEIPWLNHLRL